MKKVSSGRRINSALNSAYGDTLTFGARTFTVDKE